MAGNERDPDGTERRIDSHDLCDAVRDSNADDTWTVYSTRDRRGRLSRLDHTEQLRRLAINDMGFTERCLREADAGSAGLDPKTLALARLAALVAVGGFTDPTFPPPVIAGFEAYGAAWAMNVSDLPMPHHDYDGTSQGGPRA